MTLEVLYPVPTFAHLVRFPPYAPFICPAMPPIIETKQSKQTKAKTTPPPWNQTKTTEKYLCFFLSASPIPLHLFWWYWGLQCVIYYTPLSRQLYWQTFIAMSHWIKVSGFCYTISTGSSKELLWDILWPSLGDFGDLIVPQEQSLY